jgi:hypothetical protein
MPDKPQACPKCGEPLAENGMKDRLNCATPKCQFYWCYLTPEQWSTVRYVSEEEAATCAKYDVSCPIADNCTGSDATCGQYVAQDKAPDPGEGYVLCGSDDAEDMWVDTRATPCWESIHGTPFPIKFYRRRVEPQAQGYEDVELMRDGRDVLCVTRFVGIDYPQHHAHALASSFRGFMGFVYADDDEESLCLHPCRWRDEVGSGAIEFPVSVRFAKDKP